MKNDANQRTRRADVDGSYWVYNYDTLGQVTSGKKYWADGTPVAGQQFEYTFDDIGNRQSTKSGVFREEITWNGGGCRRETESQEVMVYLEMPWS
ncbi:MAG: hypothetical protein ACTHLW_00790 [Verrucomicrobiota bacterium]